MRVEKVLGPILSKALAFLWRSLVMMGAVHAGYGGSEMLFPSSEVDQDWSDPPTI